MISGGNNIWRPSQQPWCAYQELQQRVSCHSCRNSNQIPIPSPQFIIIHQLFFFTCTHQNRSSNEVGYYVSKTRRGGTRNIGQRGEGATDLMGCRILGCKIQNLKFHTKKKKGVQMRQPLTLVRGWLSPWKHINLTVHLFFFLVTTKLEGTHIKWLTP